MKEPRRFSLNRDRDHSGVSGTGVVAYGVMFGDGLLAEDVFVADDLEDGVFLALLLDFDDVELHHTQPPGARER